MDSVSLIYPTPEGSQVIDVPDGRVTFGRGSEADYRFPDDGLSRLHATVYRESSRVWVVDENSSNGTYVNGERVSGAGTPLTAGDELRIGHRTVLKVQVTVQKTAATAPATVAPTSNTTTAASSETPAKFSILPMILIAGAIVVVTVSALVVGIAIFSSRTPDVVVKTEQFPEDNDDPLPNKKPSQSPASGETTSTPAPDNTEIKEVPGGNTVPNTNAMPAGKKYLDLSEPERRQYLNVRSMQIAQIIGNSGSGKIPDAAIDKIKAFVDGYARRINVKPQGGCKFGDNLQTTYERASKNAAFIIKAFNEKGIDPRIGLYLAMIESEHCVCLQSGTGPLGMFQFTKATGELHGLKVRAGASPSNPDERCEPEPSARAAASYMKALTGRYGTGAASVPLAIGSYNSGEGGLSANLVKALDTNSGLPRDFWTLIANGDILSKQFQSENFKYVPKFFAAAIIGENPQDFGLTLYPLSTYSK